MPRKSKTVSKWSDLRAKNNLVRWQKVKFAAEGFGKDPRELAKQLIQADDKHGFMLASGDDPVSQAPEHHCGPSNLDYEETILLNAVEFTVSRYIGRLKGHERQECSTLPEALAAAGNDNRNLVYARAKSGRFVCLTRANFEWYAALWYVFKGE